MACNAWLDGLRDDSCAGSGSGEVLVPAVVLVGLEILAMVVQKCDGGRLVGASGQCTGVDNTEAG